MYRRRSETVLTITPVRLGIGLDPSAACLIIPDEERILLIEDTAELNIRKSNLVRLETRREQVGIPPVTVRDLLKAALRHRPDRIGSFAGPQRVRIMIESIQSAPEIDNSCEDDEALRVADPAVLQLFEEAMRNIYRESTKFGYYPNRFLQMIEERGALETARHLLHSPHLSDGFITLWEKKRLDLSVEALVSDSKWRSLFSKEDLETAVNRLKSLAS